MSSSLILPYLVLAATLVRALAIGAKAAQTQTTAKLWTPCSGCGLPHERRELGEQICRCGH